MRSPRARLCTSLVKRSLRSRLSYSTLLQIGTSMVALLWICSIVATSFFLYGFHTDDAFSSCGLTSDVCSCLHDSGVQCLNGRLSWPRTAFALLGANDAWSDQPKFSLLICPGRVQTLSSPKSASLYRSSAPL